MAPRAERRSYCSRHLPKVWVLQREADEEQVLGHEHGLHDTGEGSALLQILIHLRARQNNVLQEGREKGIHIYIYIYIYIYMARSSRFSFI